MSCFTLNGGFSPKPLALSQRSRRDIPAQQGRKETPTASQHKWTSLNGGKLDEASTGDETSPSQTKSKYSFHYHILLLLNTEGIKNCILSGQSACLQLVSYPGTRLACSPCIHQLTTMHKITIISLLDYKLGRNLETKSYLPTAGPYVQSRSKALSV